jgi:hypothetical protein
LMTGHMFSFFARSVWIVRIELKFGDGNADR